MSLTYLVVSKYKSVQNNKQTKTRGDLGQDSIQRSESLGKIYFRTCFTLLFKKYNAMFFLSTSPTLTEPDLIHNFWGFHLNDAAQNNDKWKWKFPHSITPRNAPNKTLSLVSWQGNFPHWNKSMSTVMMTMMKMMIGSSPRALWNRIEILTTGFDKQHAFHFNKTGRSACIARFEHVQGETTTTVVCGSTEDE